MDWPEKYKTGRPLSTNSFDPVQNPNWYDAYQQCLLIEPSGTPTTDKATGYARVLGHLMLEAPTSESRDYVSREILRCNGDVAKLHEFAELFILAVLPIFENNCSTPENEEDEEDAIDFFNLPIEGTPQTHISAKRAALHRDDYSCIVSRAYDFDHYRVGLSPKERESKVLKKPGVFPAQTHAWHIIPPLPAGKPDQASNFILGFFAITSDELSELAHSLTNILTLACHVGPSVSAHHLWFEAVPGTQNTYDLRSWIENYLMRLPPRVTFSTETNLPLPNPELLKMHAAICHVAHWSGALERIDFLAYQENQRTKKERRKHLERKYRGR